MEQWRWNAPQKIDAIAYNCGHCGAHVASENGWRAEYGNSQVFGARILICPSCKHPTFKTPWSQTPGDTPGAPVQSIPEENINAIYEESRRAVSVNSFTAAVLCCRKLLMHIAVSKEAEQGKGFAYYVQYLTDNHYVPRDAESWVRHIIDKGNEANHEININSREEAVELISFCEMLLRVIYEFPARANKRVDSE